MFLKRKQKGERQQRINKLSKADANSVSYNQNKRRSVRQFYDLIPQHAWSGGEPVLTWNNI